MSEKFIPAVFYGEGMVVEKRLRSIAKALVNGKSIDEAIKPEQGTNNSATIFFERESGEYGYHIAALYSMIGHAWVKRLRPGEDRAQLEQRLSEIYADLLSKPWGVLCALPIESQDLLLDNNFDVDPTKAKGFLDAVKRETPWLKTLDGRFSDTLAREGHLWGIRTTVEFLVARNKLPPPSSWQSWDSTVDALLKVYRE